MEKQPNYYWIKHHGKLIPSRWDGKFWYHGGEIHKTEYEIVSVLDPPICPPGCICTKQPDGTWNVEC